MATIRLHVGIFDTPSLVSTDITLDFAASRSMFCRNV